MSRFRKAFDHIGIFTTVPQPDEIWIAASQVWITNPRRHPQRIEYLRAKEPPTADNVGLWKLWNWPHIAYRVDNLRDALEGEEIVLGPFFPAESVLREPMEGEEILLDLFFPAEFVEVAFIHKEGVVVEYMQYRDLDHWFGDPNPPDFRHVPFTA